MVKNIAGKYRASQDIHISGWECGSEFEVKMVVEFSAHNGYPQTDEGPAEPATVEVDKVRFFRDDKDTAIKELQMPDWLVDLFTSEEGFQSWLLDQAYDQWTVALEDKADADRERMMEERDGLQ